MIISDEEVAVYMAKWTEKYGNLTDEQAACAIMNEGRIKIHEQMRDGVLSGDIEAYYSAEQNDYLYRLSDKGVVAYEKMRGIEK